MYLPMELSSTHDEQHYWPRGKMLCIQNNKTFPHMEINDNLAAKQASLTSSSSYYLSQSTITTSGPTAANTLIPTYM